MAPLPRRQWHGHGPARAGPSHAPSFAHGHHVSHGAVPAMLLVPGRSRRARRALALLLALAALAGVGYGVRRLSWQGSEMLGAGVGGEGRALGAQGEGQGGSVAAVVNAAQAAASGANGSGGAAAGNGAAGASGGGGGGGAAVASGVVGSGELTSDPEGGSSSSGASGAAGSTAAQTPPSSSARRCYATTNAEYRGRVLRTGSDHIVPTPEACCAACASEPECDVWVHCPEQEGCGGERAFGECWLKHLDLAGAGRGDVLNPPGARGPGILWTSGINVDEAVVERARAAEAQAQRAETARLEALRANESLPLVFLDVAILDASKGAKVEPGTYGGVRSLIEETAAGAAEDRAYDASALAGGRKGGAAFASGAGAGADGGDGGASVSGSGSGSALPATYRGRIEIVLFPDTSPRAAENFRRLCTGEAGVVPHGRPGAGRRLWLRGASFYRIIHDFIDQGGIDADSALGGQFRDDAGGLALRHAHKGLLSMANTGPNTNTAHFSIMMNPAPHLDGHYTIFGQVVRGFEAAQAINRLSATSPDASATAAAGAVVENAGQIRMGSIIPNLDGP